MNCAFTRLVSQKDCIDMLVEINGTAKPLADHGPGKRIICSRRNFANEKPVPLWELSWYTANALPALLMRAILLYGFYGSVATPMKAAIVKAGFHHVEIAA